MLRGISEDRTDVNGGNARPVGVACVTQSVAPSVYGDRSWAVEDRNISCHLPEDNNARRGNAATAIIDYEMIGTPQAERTDREVSLSCKLRQGGGQVSRLFLAEMVGHFDRQWQHPRQRSGGFVVGEGHG